MTTDGVPLRLRETADLDAATLTQIPDGTTLVGTETQTADGYTWAKVEYGGKSGWCAVSDGLTSPEIDYHLKSDIVYRYSTTAMYTLSWTYGSGGKDGLVNDTTMALFKEGYTFVGWSASTDGSSTIFDQDDTTLKAEDICPDVANKSQSITLYAVWQKDSCGNHSYSYSFADNVHSFTCAACGETVTKTATDGKQFKFNTAAPTLSDDIVMNIATTVPAGFENPYMVVEFNGVTTISYSYVIDAATGRFKFAFAGINPQTMGDSFHAALYATVEGVEVSVSLDYSMLKYINSQLKKSTTSAVLRTALSDLVMYGEANQVYEGYKTDALLSDLLESTATLTPSIFPGLDDSYNAQTTSGTKDANIDLKGVSMILGSKVMVRMTTYCADPSAYSVKVNIGELEYTYAVSDLALAEGYTDRYVVAFDQIKATQFGDVITFSFLDADGNQVGRTLTCSVYTYVQKNQANSDTNLVALLEALYNYGESVKNI